MITFFIQNFHLENRSIRQFLQTHVFILLFCLLGCGSANQAIEGDSENELELFYEVGAVGFPVEQSSLSFLASTFGPRLKSSDGNRYDFHRGLDIVGDRGASVLAIADGEIIRVYDEGSEAYPNLGRVVIVEHSDVTDFVFQGTTVSKYYSLYGHLDGFSEVSQRVLDENLPQPVAAGDLLGEMGDSGTTDLVHLHFEIRLQTTCSLEYQLANSSLDCATVGFDPHINPVDLFLESLASDDVYGLEITQDSGVLHIEATAARPYFNLDGVTIEVYTNSNSDSTLFEQRYSFNTREGFDATSTETLDQAEIPPLTVLPQSLGVDDNQYEIGFDVDLSEFGDAHFVRVDLHSTEAIVKTETLEF